MQPGSADMVVRRTCDTELSLMPASYSDTLHRALAVDPILVLKPGWKNKGNRGIVPTPQTLGSALSDLPR